MDLTTLNIFDFTNISEHMDFYKKDYFIFGLYQIRADGSCGCEYPECKNIGKHPIRSGWQHPIKWDEEQMAVGHLAGQFKTGYGVLMRGLLVIDVDAKNGGVASFKQLMRDLPDLAQCGLVVDTGSGGGSQHWYFTYNGEKPLRQAHELYPGIDFKSTGFVVGPGSSHKSGKKYTINRGSVDDIGEAPPSLLTLLEKTGSYRVNDDDRAVDVTEAELKEMLFSIKGDLPYDDWLAVGMALNSALNGEGFELFDEWSSRSEKYDGATTHRKWRSFTPGAGYGFATLKWYALQHGWIEPVTFTAGEVVEADTPFSLEGIDLHRPPGFVGDLCDWINDQSPKPRENLAATAALVAMGNLGAMRYKDGLPRGSTSNIFSMCVAGSGSGKNAIMGAVNQIHEVCGLMSVTYGESKSSQEIYRNLIDKSISLYNIDELGIKLAAIANAAKNGTTYFEAWFGVMMGVYSNANGIVPLSGDAMRDIQKTLMQRMADARKAMDENELDRAKGQQIIESLQERIKTPALIRPFVSMIGFTTPETVEPIITPERVREGFLGRSIIAWEPVDLPRTKANFAPRAMTPAMKMSLQAIASGGFGGLEPWEESDHRVIVTTTPEARAVLNALEEYFHRMAEEYRDSNGMHAVPARGEELVLKISYILGIPGRQRTLEHVKWAFAYTLADIDRKVKMALGNSDRDDALYNKILSLVDPVEPITEGRLIDRAKGKKRFTSGQVSSVLDSMVKSGSILRSVSTNPTNGTEKVTYLLSK